MWKARTDQKKSGIFQSAPEQPSPIIGMKMSGVKPITNVHWSITRAVKPYLKKQHFVVLWTQAPPLFDCFLDIQSVVANLMIIKDTGAD